MECDRAREMLWPMAGPRAYTEASQAAKAHVDDCAACAAFFGRDELLGRRLSGLDFAESAPQELHASIAEEMSRSPADVAGDVRVSGTGFQRFRRWRLPMAAAAVLVAFLAGLEISQVESRADRADLFADDFLHMAAASPTNTDPASIENFYQDQIGEEIRPVQVANATVNKALVCDIGGARGATIEYELDGERLAHYRIPVRQMKSRPTGAVEMSDVGDGVHVARWVDDQYEHALVGTVSTEKMEELIRNEFGQDTDF